KSWASFLTPIEPVDPGFYLRLGKVFEAAARSLPADRFFCQTELDNAVWLEILLQEGTLTQARTWSSVQRSGALSGPFIEAMLKADRCHDTHFLTAPFKIAKTRAWQQNQMREMVLRVADIGKSWAGHRDLIVPFLTDESAEIRLRAVENLARGGAPVE